MVIHSGTRIASLLKQDKNALEAIISLSPAFNKLRNPLLRKLMAGRATIGMAAKIGGCKPQDFYAVLKPLGFINEAEIPVKEEPAKPIPDFVSQLNPKAWQDFDVRPILDGGEDPLEQILKKVNALQPGNGLRIINSFEPTPLIQLLEKKGFQTYVEMQSASLFITYFLKTAKQQTELPQVQGNQSDWDQLIQKYRNQTREIDVRHLEMPMPMHAILDALGAMNKGDALLVHHKRVPVFLLPELAEREFDYRIKQIAEGEVWLLIFKKNKS